MDWDDAKQCKLSAAVAIHKASESLKSFGWLDSVDDTNKKRIAFVVCMVIAPCVWENYAGFKEPCGREYSHAFRKVFIGCEVFDDELGNDITEKHLRWQFDPRVALWGDPLAAITNARMNLERVRYVMETMGI